MISTRPSCIVARRYARTASAFSAFTSWGHGVGSTTCAQCTQASISSSASWKQTSPTVWRFALRKGVVFHGGEKFTADDVVFTFKRAAGDGSDMKGYTSSIKEVRKVDDFNVEIETTAPFPILPDVISLVYIMSKSWCETNKAEKPVDRRKGIENAASFRANGTGPFSLAERTPDVSTMLDANENWWNEGPNVDGIEIRIIPDEASILAALRAGTIDFALLNDPRISSARVDATFRVLPTDVQQELEPLRRVLSQRMLLTDPPTHTRLKNLVMPAFAARIVYSACMPFGRTTYTMSISGLSLMRSKLW